MKKKIQLPNVTLLTITSTELDMTNLSMKISLQNIDFADAKFVSHEVPKKKYPDINYILLKKKIDITEYNRIVIEDLHKYFNTSHCLILQADSFVVNSDLWKDEFLKFDYIGAPWPNKIKVNSDLILDVKKNPVGNGGFSLRSHKLAKVTAKINYNSLNFPIKSEDIIICHYLYKEMTEQGIHFASPKLASQFSMENISHLYDQDVNSVFGFHGKHLREYFLKKYVLRTSIGEW